MNAPKADFITILKHRAIPMAKTWRMDGTVDGYSSGKYFDHQRLEIKNIRDLSAALTNLEKLSKSCVIRGEYRGDTFATTTDPEHKQGQVLRRKELFDDTPHHWLLVEVDDFIPLGADPVLDPVVCIEEYVSTHLPAEFHDCTYHWQLSNSAGLPKNRDKLKAHIWYWAANKHSSNSLKAWAESCNIELDTSVFDSIQVHYTSAPILEKGLRNPVPIRCGLVQKSIDAVSLVIPILCEAEHKFVGRNAQIEHAHLADPVAVLLNEKGMVKSIGKKGELFIDCPRREHHTGESNETSTAYFPANTGGYPDGNFKCLHAHCQDVAQREFREALGITPDDDFDEVPAELGELPDAAIDGLTTTGIWPDPYPIPDDLPPVPPFKLTLLPDALRPWIEDIAERMQISPDIPAIGAVTALSAAIGRRAQIMPKAHDDWTVVPNLWGLVVAPPGYMKSPALSEAMKPLNRLENEAHREYEAAHLAWEMEKERTAIAKAAAKSAAINTLKKNATAEIPPTLAEPNEPTSTRYCVNNFSLEALGEVLIGNPSGVLAFSDEIHGLLMMAQKPGNEGLNDFLLSAWNGDGAFTFDRIGRGLNRRIDHVCVAVLGGIQPGRLVEHVTGATHGGSGDSGLVQRFQLLTWPDMAKEWKLIDRKPDRDAQDAAYRVFERVVGGAPSLDIGIEGEAESGLDVRHFDIDAQSRFYGWLERLERELRNDTLLPVIASHLSKFRSLVPSLALIFAVADNVRGSIPLRYLEQAIGWADYLRPHAERVYACTTRPETRQARALLAKIKAADVEDGFTLRDVYSKGWSLLDRDGVKKAVALLCDLGYLRAIQKPQAATGGRPSITYQIHPNAKR